MTGSSYDTWWSYWLFLITAIRVTIFVLSYTSNNFLKQFFPRAIHLTNPLLSRTVGTAALTSAFLSLHAALNVQSRDAQLANWWGFAMVVWQYTTEWLWYGTKDWKQARGGLVVDGGTAVVAAWRLWG